MPDTSKMFPRSIWVIGVAFSLLAIVALARFQTPVEKVAWRTDYPAAMVDAAKTGKPVLLDFSATWCGPCQDMKRSTWSDSAVATALSSKVPITIDPDKNPELVRQYHVEAFPTMILLSPTGMPLNETVGYQGPEDFLAWLRSPPLR